MLPAPVALLHPLRGLPGPDVWKKTPQAESKKKTDGRAITYPDAPMRSFSKSIPFLLFVDLLFGLKKRDTRDTSMGSRERRLWRNEGSF